MTPYKTVTVAELARMLQSMPADAKVVFGRDEHPAPTARPGGAGSGVSRWLPGEGEPGPGPAVPIEAPTVEEVTPETVKSAKRKLKALLTDNAVERWEERKRSGRLSTARLPEMFTTGKVFARKSEHGGARSYAVLVLVDCSGSMNRDGKMQCAGQAVRDLLVLLDGAVDVAVAGYNVKFSLVKPFGSGIEPGKVKEELRRLTNDEDIYYGNHDAYMVDKAVKELSKVDAEKRILIVLSDGRPSCDYALEKQKSKRCRHPGCGDNNKLGRELRDTVARIHARKSVSLFTVGVLTSDVQQFYRESAVIWNAQDIFPAVLGYLKKKIRRAI